MYFSQTTASLCVCVCVRDRLLCTVLDVLDATAANVVTSLVHLPAQINIFLTFFPPCSFSRDTLASHSFRL